MTTRKIPKVPPLPSVPQNAGPRELEEHMLSLRATLSDILSDQNFHINKALLSGENAVTEADLADGSVKTAKIADLNVTNAKIGDGEVDFDVKVADGSDFKKIQVGTLSARPAAGTSGRRYLAIDGGANGEAILFRDTGSSWKEETGRDMDDIIDGTSFGRVDITTLDGSKIKTIRKSTQNTDVDADEIIDAVNDSLDKVPDGSTFVRLGSVDNSNQATTSSLADLIVTSAKIADLAVDTAKINDLSADKINAGSLSASFIDIDGITLANNSGTLVISDGGVDTTQLADLSVGSAKIQDLAVESAKIQDLAVENAKIGNLSVSTGKVKDDAITEIAFTESNVRESLSASSVTEQEIDTLETTFTSSGNSNATLILVLSLSLRWDVNDGDTMSCIVKIKRNGSNLRTMVASAIPASDRATTPTSDIRQIELSLEVAATGNQDTYEVFVEQNNNGGGGEFQAADSFSAEPGRSLTIFQRIK